jgi:uncharacterized protein YciI
MASTIARVFFSRTRPAPLFSRKISNASALERKEQKFFVYALDKTEEGTLAKRYDVRPQHLEKLQPLVDSGTVRKWIMTLHVKLTLLNDVMCTGLGGMLLSPEAMETEGRGGKAVGSLLIVQAKTMEEARKMIESDLYYTSGVVSRSYTRSRHILAHRLTDSGTARKLSFYRLSLPPLSRRIVVARCRSRRPNVLTYDGGHSNSAC